MVLCHLAFQDPETLRSRHRGSLLAQPRAHQNSDVESKCAVQTITGRWKEKQQKKFKDIVGLGSLCRPDVWACSEKPKSIQSNQFPGPEIFGLVLLAYLLPSPHTLCWNCHSMLLFIRVSFSNQVQLFQPQKGSQISSLLDKMVNSQPSPQCLQHHTNINSHLLPGACSA